MVEEIVSVGKSMGWWMRDVNQLIEEQSQELTNQELKDLHSQQHMVVQGKISYEEEPGLEQVISTRDNLFYYRHKKTIKNYRIKNTRKK